MATMDTTCLFSSVKNVSGRRKKFGFLPPHGRELAINEEFTVYGDVRQAILGARGSERASSRRDIIAFEAAIARGDLVIVHTPAPILYDPTDEVSKMLSLDNGTLGSVDPCWADSVSE